ncbi:MAG: aspartate--tRNA ligase [Anaerolineae bacterium]|uniref:aspartate--tRNA ligase n=1 Tax=Promineifilum sp. TaxID=2664178 RepID=UPI001D73FFFB|nr:aspartate--tRNA ligase [Anaerolineales bacterium]MCB8934682.1 aspartate--tRNA ligase [Promineifilum sp.]MCO5180960.1 aspartate--tRNA ligase [Promineifilum sp.]MCW5846678.1 aspartate--tRNA ligase [Anaerolineae bacterium]
MLKTHSCGELRREHVGQTVTLAGWVNRRRDMGGVIFIDLRDRAGKTQAVVDSGRTPEGFAAAEGIRSEYVVQVTGVVSPRPEGQVNANLPTGEIEVLVDQVVILNTAKTTPFLIDRDDTVDETTRLRYRYLDLRRERLQRNLMLRHNAIKFIRDFLAERGFIEIETPILFKSTPEGARDYLVPSRVHPGKFYALPQSPQQLKQLLMVAGYERYFQIARCFRDEDLRADRQPEFTQLDMEMSFVERDDILNLVEELMIGMVQAVSLVPLASTTFARLSYAEATERFGTDRPDLRYGMELKDISDIVGSSAFRVFAENVAAGKPVKAICAPGCASYSRKQLDELEGMAREQGAKALAWLAIQPDSGEMRGPIAKFFTVDQLIAITERLDAQPGDLILISSDSKAIVHNVLSTLRTELARRLGYTDKKELAFAWVIDFPLFEEGLEDGHFAPSHHMFTAPKPEHIALLDTDPAAVLSQQYDLVCNGFEVAGGSIRIHDQTLQAKIMSLIGFSMEQAKEQFGHLLEAFEFGAPPHGGIAPGIDRLVALMAGEPNIREVMAFPKTAQATDLMADAPSVVLPRQLDELQLAIKEKPAKAS